MVDSKPLTYLTGGLHYDSEEGVWDEEKNARKHRVTFEEATQLFMSDSDYLELCHDAHSLAEDRFIAIGPIERAIVLVVRTERYQNSIRIISARWATPREKTLFQTYMGNA